MSVVPLHLKLHVSVIVSDVLPKRYSRLFRFIVYLYRSILHKVLMVASLYDYPSYDYPSSGETNSSWFG